MDQIPKPLLVTVVFLLGIGFIMYSNPQYTKCNAQLAIFTTNMTGEIYPKQAKKMMMPPRLRAYLESCKLGNGSGGCFEMLEFMGRLNREIQSFPEECHASLAEVGEVRGALSETLKLMVQLAWGEQPPESPEKRLGWFEPADMVTFCKSRSHFERLFGPENYEAFRTSVSGSLPAEPPKFEDSKCVNCEFRKKARDVMTPGDMYRLSLFSVPCANFR